MNLCISPPKQVKKTNKSNDVACDDANTQIFVRNLAESFLYLPKIPRKNDIFATYAHKPTHQWVELYVY